MEDITVNITESITANMEKNNSKNKWKILMLLFVVGALVAAIVLGIGKGRQNQANDVYEELAEQTNLPETENCVKSEGPALQKDASENSGETTTQQATATEIVILTPEPISPNFNYEKDIEQLKKMGIAVPEKKIDFQELMSQVNVHIYAWIYIPDTLIDYPVLQHPTDNSYYLERNLDGSKGYPGCIYTEDYNAKDFSDPLTVLYGHNMKNGTMFAGLHKYADEEYLLQHPYVYIYTPERLYVYEIFAAHEHGDAHLLLNGDMTSDVIFRGFIDEILTQRSMNHYVKDGVEITAEDSIITLSTCIKTKPDKRYLVQGVLVNEN